MSRHIPNFITSLNLLSGCIALVFAFQGQLVTASLFIGLGAFFDFIDGFVARLLHVKSPIGKELDSLADVITFGVVPGTLVYLLLQQDLSAPTLYLGNLSILPFLGFLIPVFSALRLAKFNVDTRQETVFFGLPTPASALFFGSFPLILMQEETLLGNSLGNIHQLITNFYVLLALTVLICWLMVSEIRLFSLKFTTLLWSGNKIRYLFLVLSILMLVFLHFLALPLIILLYVFFSLISFRTLSS